MNTFRMKVVNWFVGPGVWTSRLLDMVTTGIVWLAVLMTAYGVSNLAEAIVDTIRYGHPR